MVRALNMISLCRGLASGFTLGPLKTKFMSRLNSTKASPPSASGGVWVTAFETVMQDLYGDQWKEKLSRRGTRFVERKEAGREFTGKLKASSAADMPLPPAHDSYNPADWHRRAQEIKLRILQGGGDTRVKREAIAEARKAHSQT